jgi:hypothetical protein
MKDKEYTKDDYFKDEFSKEETLNLNKLESQLDNALAKETKESLTNWLDSKRNKETLEEAAYKYAVKKRVIKRLSNREFDLCQIDFIKGAKWQQEQDKNKYSEEDMVVFGNKMQLISDVDFDGNVKFVFNPSEAINQFKNEIRYA